MKSVVIPAALAAIIVFAPHDARANVVTRWNALSSEAAKAACLIASGNGLAEARMYAMVQVAVHDALNAIDRRSQPYAYDVRVKARTSVRAAVATAAHDVLVAVIGQLQESTQCIADGIARADADLAAELAAIPDSPAKSRGVDVGRAAAVAIVHLRQSDGSLIPLLDFGYEQGDEPGEYRFTPGFNFVFAPLWAKVTPFVLNDPAQFRASPPYPIRSKKYAADYNEIKKVGGIGEPITPTTRTEEQTEIGLFWVESSPFAWNRLARSLSARKGLDAWESARLFGLLNLAMADGYIGSWESKYHYSFWRPVTAIHEGDADGNPDTAGDPTWTPLVLTYPIPDHDSGHAVQGGVAAEVLKRFFRTDRIRFKACSMTLPAGSTCDDASPVLRRFKSFSQAADENAVSRIYIGIHFRRAVEEGVRHGRRIGKWTVAHYLREVK